MIIPQLLRIPPLLMLGAQIYHLEGTATVCALGFLAAAHVAGSLIADDEGR